MDVQDLIYKVQLNPAIWDKRIKDYSNRNIVDACWKKIASEMKIDGNILRKKWKYLRDQFSVEYSKIKSPRSGDSAETATEPTWPHFKRMLFLKDIVTPRACPSNLKQKSITFTDDKEIKGEHDLSRCADEQETDSIDSNLQERENPYEYVTETQPAELKLPVNPSTSQPRKRRRLMEINTLFNEVVQLEQQKIDTMQRAFQREPDSDDMMFFKSLMPFVSKIPTELKLRFRSRIQQVVEEFAFVGRPLQQQSPGLSTTPYDSGRVENYHKISPASGGKSPQNQNALPGS